MSQASTVSLIPSSVSTEQKKNEDKTLDLGCPGMNLPKISLEANNLCPLIEQIKSENLSQLKEPCVKNELSCPTNNGTSQEHKGGIGGHKLAAASMMVLSGQSFPANASESVRNAHVLAVFKEGRDCTSSITLGE